MLDTLNVLATQPLRVRLVVPAMEAVQMANGLPDFSPYVFFRSDTQRSALVAFAEPKRSFIVRRNCPVREDISFPPKTPPTGTRPFFSAIPYEPVIERLDERLFISQLNPFPG